MTKYEIKIQGTYDYEFTTTSKEDIVTIIQAIVDRLINDGYTNINFDPNNIYSGWWLIDEEQLSGGIYVQVETTEVNIDKIVDLVC